MKEAFLLKTFAKKKERKENCQRQFKKFRQLSSLGEVKSSTKDPV